MNLRSTSLLLESQLFLSHPSFSRSPYNIFCGGSKGRQPLWGLPHIPALHSRWSSRHFGFEKNGMGTTQEGASCKVSSDMIWILNW